MNNIVVSGYYGSKNAGDEAMLAAMLEVFTELDPKTKFTVISANPEDTKKRHGVDSIGWLDILAIIKTLKKSDLLLSGGGSLLQNVTSGRSLYYYLGILFLAKLLNTPVMLYAQGIGPVYGWLPRKLMKWICSRAKYITIRDAGSLSELKQLKVTKPAIKVTADPVLAIHPVAIDIGRKILAANKVLLTKPIIGICPREWRGLKHYKLTLAALADKINENFAAQIVFIPMQFPEDVKVSGKIASYMKTKPIILNDEYTTGELLSLTGNMDMLISIRLHALIFAGVMGVPMIGLSYDPKIDRFLNSIGEKAVNTLEDADVDKILHEFTQKWRNKDEFKAMNKNRLAQLRKDAYSNAETALSLLIKK
ncbi:polysaccharide pyruvyl transferase CsaB [Pectinatus brassicae]|uniref:Polysaccharide pyruvyl transferase CsaB n=1 Tax=Pectinatus brassicae TaxID=862415 RepID=A0A840USM5_9FIRM|nr:polysaccharide pyruvyl transferase CsaB [Pectinatus brassicae]MBB5335824.1 polysaccharide pyruvyl transferase CsaB [Pectinatus brassicae]